MVRNRPVPNRIVTVGDPSRQGPLSPSLASLGSNSRPTSARSGISRRSRPGSAKNTVCFGGDDSSTGGHETETQFSSPATTYRHDSHRRNHSDAPSLMNSSAVDEGFGYTQEVNDSDKSMKTEGGLKLRKPKRRESLFNGPRVSVEDSPTEIADPVISQSEELSAGNQKELSSMLKKAPAHKRHSSHIAVQFGYDSESMTEQEVVNILSKGVITGTIEEEISKRSIKKGAETSSGVSEQKFNTAVHRHTPKAPSIFGTIALALSYQTEGVKYKMWTDGDLAAKLGYLSLIREKHRHNEPLLMTRKAMALAVKSGHLAITKWISSHRMEGCDKETMDLACEHGHLSIAEWLHEHRTEGCTSNAMDRAAANGHLPMVKWLHEKTDEGCTHQAMDNAAANGHLELLVWLSNFRSEGCTTAAMDRAAGNNQIGVLRWLHDNRSEGYSMKAMTLAAANGHVEVLNWLNKYDCSMSEEGIVLAAKNGHLKVLQWLTQNREELEVVPQEAVREACKSGRLEVLNFLLTLGAEVNSDCVDAAAAGDPRNLMMLNFLTKNYPDLRGTDAALDYAAERGVIEIVQYIDKCRSEGCSTHAMDMAAANGHLEVVKYLHQNRSEGCTTRAMDYAAANGHFDVVTWLDENRSEGGSTAAIDMAATNGHLRVVVYLVNIRYDGFTKDALSGALLNGHMKVAMYLYDYCNASFWDETLCDTARKGLLPAVAWILEVTNNRLPCCIDGVHHVDVLEYLYRELGDKLEYSSDAFDSAAGSGELSVVMWLDKYLKAPCTERAINDCAKNGHMDVLHYLSKNKPHLRPSMNSLNGAARHGHWKVLVYLVKSMGMVPNAYTMNAAATNNHTKCVEWLKTEFKLNPTKEGFISTCAYGHISAVKILCELSPTAPSSTDAMDRAARNGHISVVRYLHRNRKEGCTVLAMDWACEFGHTDIVRFLNIERDEGCTSNALDMAARNAHINIVRYLLRQKKGHLKSALYNAKLSGSKYIENKIEEALKKSQKARTENVVKESAKSEAERQSI